MRGFFLLAVLCSGAVVSSGVALTQSSISLAGAEEQQADKKQGRCDFSNYNPLRISHPLVNAAIKKVQPQYPAIAKAARAEGDVEVRILVNRNGEVIEACAVEGPPLLRAAAVSAALRWRFKRNFGFTNRPKRQYVESVIGFNFRLDGDTAETTPCSAPRANRSSGSRQR